MINSAGRYDQYVMSRRVGHRRQSRLRAHSGEHTGTNSGGHDHLDQRPSGARHRRDKQGLGQSAREAAVATWART
jgi:hypothetical protein